MNKEKSKLIKVKNNRKGITLIALVITVVIMIIIAGIVISIITSDDGLFDNVQYSSEVSKFEQVREAIKIYGLMTKIDSEEISLPIKRNVTLSELNSNQSLKSEIGYYRAFLITGEKPILPQDFSGEFMEIPNGIADLYYLDNEKLKIDVNKEYIYDMVTGEIYVVDGLKLNNEIVYSESGIHEIMNENFIPDYIGEQELPASPPANTGAGYDFKFADVSNQDTNLYKVYNNGDIYAIGKRGILLQSSEEELENIRNDRWEEINFNEILPGFKEVFVGSQNYRNSQVLITNDGEAYVSGLNGKDIANKFVLTQEVLERYNGNNLNKLDFEYGKVKKVFTGDDTVFIITEDNKLYASGRNDYGQLGIGVYGNSAEYKEVKGIPDIEKIKYIHTYATYLYCTIIELEDNRFYFSGSNGHGFLGDGRGTYKTNIFEQIWHTGEFDIDQDIEKLVLLSSGSAILKKDGTVLIGTNNANLELTDFIDTDKNKFRRLREEVGSNITNIIPHYSCGLVLEKTINGEQKYYGYANDLPQNIGIGEKNFTIDERKLYEIELPTELKQDGVKEYNNVHGRNGLLFISNTGNVYYTGAASFSGIEGQTDTVLSVTKVPISNIDGFYKTDINYGMVYTYLQGKDGKVYTIQNPLTQLSKSLYDYSFKRIITDAKDVVTVLNDNGGCISYVSNDNNLYVAGPDKSMLGLGTIETSQQFKFEKVNDLNINDKVKEAYFSTNLYVLTTEGKLYATGTSGNNGNSGAGWSEQTNQISFVEILSNVEDGAVSFGSKIFYNQEKMWVWSANQEWGETYNTPYEYDLESIDPSLKYNIEMVDCLNYLIGSFILTKDGKVWSMGNSAHCTGTGVKHNVFTQIPQESFNNKKIVKIICPGVDKSVIVALTEDGNVYGWGADVSVLGLGITTSTVQLTPTLLPIDNVVDIVATASGFIATKGNGEVWATGNNSNGIFGRWISKDGVYASTISQNAYEWVRCPSLEK